uniref:Biogenesis of lysosome-related organelles complex 1 subunit KXD1 n=1 Tax=Parastrongyloides trichosuri TaxID=131310 RepID=A0A0N5A6Z2_PARTI
MTLKDELFNIIVKANCVKFVETNDDAMGPRKSKKIVENKMEEMETDVEDLNSVEIIEDENIQVVQQQGCSEQSLEEEIYNLSSLISNRLLRLRKRVDNCESDLMDHATYLNETSFATLKTSKEEKRRFVLNKRKVNTLKEVIREIEIQTNTIKSLI